MVLTLLAQNIPLLVAEGLHGGWQTMGKPVRNPNHCNRQIWHKTNLGIFTFVGAAQINLLNVSSWRQETRTTGQWVHININIRIRTRGGYSSSSRAGRLGRTLWPQNSTSVAETEKGGQNSTMTPPTLEKGGQYSTSVWKVCKKGGQKSTILKNIGVKILQCLKKGGSIFYIRYPKYSEYPPPGDQNQCYKGEGLTGKTLMHGLVQHCSNSRALAMELLQSCGKPPIYT